jgi:lipopolysaccharide export system permease protein
VFFFIGAPLGAIIRKGGLGTPIVVSVVFFLIYYMITLTGEKLVREDVWYPFTGMWLASIILFIAGVFLTYKATTDSVILNTDTYVNFVKNLIKIKKSPKNENPAGKQ